MTELSGTRVQALFDRAVELPAAERAAFLEASCAGDPALRAEVESLLATDEQLGDLDLLASPLVRAADPSFGAPWPRIGCYRIVRPIAEGGMGAVYEAEQDNPRRRVALKVVRPGLASPVLLKRFALEAQILGRLQHPGIAQVYEAGVSDNGQPFFAMQFVSGRSLIEYAHAKSLSLSARLELMAKTCDAVQYAHDQGVIHRDLKPANILVDDTGQPKVLDFGLARVTGNNLLNGDGLTHSGQLFGTPNYMSPEQASADFAAIDHRADVYALGVILFELLAHRLPYRLEGHPLAEATRILLEEEPPRLGSFDPALRGDLDTAVAKALEKDPRRRYPSAAELAADLRRFLAHEPILARSPSAFYRLSKFTRRNKVLVGGFVTTAAALVLGLLGTIHFAVGEARQRNRAVAEKEEAEFQAYRARIAAAIAALTAHDVVDAGRQLDEAPEELRGWEWRHLRSRLDDSSSAVALPVPEGTFLNGAPGPATVCELTSAGLRLTDLEGGSTRTVPIGREHGWHVVASETSLGLRVARWIDKTTLVLEDESGRRLGEVQVPAAQQPEPIALSPDGTRLATHWADGQWRRIGVFDATSGESVAVCQGHLAGIWSLTFSPDGTRLASSGEDLAARLWDPSTGALIASCEGHRSKVLSVAFRSDGARLVTASSDGAVRQWDAATGREAEPSYDRHSGEVAAAVYSPDGRLVASAGTDRTIRLWQATGREDVAILHGHTGPVTRLAFSASGRRLASLSLTWIFASGDDTLRTWDTESLANSLVLRGHTQSVSAVAYSPDGRWLASGGWDGAVRVWHSATGEPRATLTHPGVVPWLAFASDSQRLVSVNYADNRLRIWDIVTAEVTQEIQGPVGKLQSVHLSPKGMQAAATTFDQEKHHFEITEIATGKLLFASEGKALAYSPNGKWLAILASDEKTIALLDARSHAPVVHFRGHEQAVLGALFSPDSCRLASFGRDQTVRLWRLDDGECQVLRGHTDEVFCGAFHPDGARLATGGRDRAIWLWDLARGDDVARLLGHTSYVSSLAFSPDGATLASGSGDAAVRLWSTVPLKSRDKLEGEASVEGSSMTSAPGNSPADENQM